MTKAIATNDSEPLVPGDGWTTEALIGFVRTEKIAVDESIAKLSDLMRGTAARAWRIGLALAILKDRAGHGNWLDWLAANLPDISHDIVARYMRLYTHWANAESVQNLTVAKAMRMIHVAASNPALARRTPNGRLLSVRIPSVSKARPAIVGGDDPASSVAANDAIQAICLRLALDDIGAVIARRIMSGQGDSEIAKELMARAREVAILHQRIRAVAEELNLGG